ncbi:MAG TPA: hypothetical protein VK510_17875 [Solirubrobacteraceae bacterium]|jgi:hypothetical protein|nr:hypothetical protein [Solirubrobacteraceae bacterium]
MDAAHSLAAALTALALPATAAAKTTESFVLPRGGEALVALTAAARCSLAVRAAGLVSSAHAAGRVWR